MSVTETQEFEHSPLEEADPQSLSELFSRDPLSLSAQDLEQIVKALRAAREQFAKDDEQAQSTGKRVRTKAGKEKPKAAELMQLSIDDLLGDVG